MSVPLTRIVPAAGILKPPIRSIRVDFPDPLGPYSATVSPATICNDTSSTARTVSPPTSKHLTRRSTQSISTLGTSSRRPMLVEVGDVGVLVHQFELAVTEFPDSRRSQRSSMIRDGHQHRTGTILRKTFHEIHRGALLIETHTIEKIVHEQQPRSPHNRLRKLHQHPLPIREIRPHRARALRYIKLRQDVLYQPSTLTSTVSTGRGERELDVIVNVQAILFSPDSDSEICSENMPEIAV